MARLVPARTSTVAAWVLPHLIAHVSGRGIDVTPLRQVPGLRGRDLDDPDVRVPDTAAAEAWRVAVRITEDEALGLHMAQAIPAGALDLLEYAFRSSATVLTGLDQFSRYGRVLGDRAAARLVRQEAALAVSWDVHAIRGRVDFALALVLRLVREATGRPVAPTEVRFTYARPQHRLEYRDYFRAPLTFGARANQLVLALADTARPLVSADAALAGVARRRLEKMLSQLPGLDESAATRVRRLVLETLTHGEPTARAASQALGVSERTLHRRLREERTSFRRILDQVRHELATSLLDDRTVGIAEIAFILGYSEPAAFHRSFRRWTGQTPLTFRRGAARA